MPPSVTPSCSTVRRGSGRRWPAETIMRAGPWPLNLRPTCSVILLSNSRAASSTRARPTPTCPAGSRSGYWDWSTRLGAALAQPALLKASATTPTASTRKHSASYTQLLNCLAFEVEAAVSYLSLVGRIHHRSAFGTYSGSRREQWLLARPALPLGTGHTQKGERCDASPARM